MNDLFPVVIDRQTWLRGKCGGALYNKRLAAEGKPHMCCIGFVCRQAGLPIEVIEDIGTVRGLLNADRGFDKVEDLPPILQPFVTATDEKTLAGHYKGSGPFGSYLSSSDKAVLLYNTNDDYLETQYIDKLTRPGALQTEADREAKLIELGRALGIEFRFVN